MIRYARLAAVALLTAVGTAVACAAPPPALKPLGPAGAPAAAFPRAARPVAEIVAPIWSGENQRDRAGEIGQIVRALNLRAGMTVADVGAGEGYDAVRLARVVGPRGTIYAQDIREDYLRRLGARLTRDRLTNVRLALGEPHDPRLPPASADAAVLVHMYHEVASPYAFLYNLAPALKPGAPVAIIDADRPTPEHGTPPALVRCELEAVGYRFVSQRVLQGDLGYLAIFRAPAPAARPKPTAIRPCHGT